MRRWADTIAVAAEKEFRKTKRERRIELEDQRRQIAEIPPLRCGGMTDAEREEWQRELAIKVRVVNNHVTGGASAFFRVTP